MRILPTAIVSVLLSLAFIAAMHRLMSIPMGVQSCDYEMLGAPCVIEDYAGHHGGECPEGYDANFEGIDCYLDMGW